jgi:hypothetical protein
MAAGPVIPAVGPHTQDSRFDERESRCTESAFCREAAYVPVGPAAAWAKVHAVRAIDHMKAADRGIERHKKLLDSSYIIRGFDDEAFYSIDE